MEKFLNRLHGVKKSGAGWSARCPSHDDRRASLSISQGDNGGLVCHCHAGCSPEAVAGAIGLTLADLMPSENGNGQASKGEIVKTYDYRDADGKVVYQAVRYANKGFSQRQPDPNGGWINNVKGVHRVLYRLPELLATGPPETVFGCEGEKDVDRLIGLGLVATCNVGGAGKWRKEYNQHFAGRRVVVLPDNDGPGKDHADQVAESLQGAAESVKVLELPGLPPKGDVSDWLNNGGTVEELVALASSCPEWEPMPDSGPADSEEAEPITNAEVEKDESGERIIPLTMTEVVDRIFKRTGGWPRLVDGALFVDDGGICWLSSPADMFGLLSRLVGNVPWRRATGCVSREETFSEIKRTATRYRALEQMPHHPKVDGHYYSCTFPKDGDGEHLETLLDYFKPATPLDRELLRAAYATPVWGGPAGCRPAFMFTSKTGRGKGKSKLAQSIGELHGGCVDISPSEDTGKIKTRLLSPNAMPLRVALLDNVKTTRFSWGDLEAMITSAAIGGHRMYHGEGSRPNYLTWLITLNGASLSTDMAQRVVEIQLSEPDYEGGWEEKVRHYIDANRERIIGDLIGFLKREPKHLQRSTRWATWESDVLSRVADSPSECIDLIVERHGAVDVEEEEGGIVEDYFAGRLRWLDYDLERDDVFVPNETALRWFNEATGDRVKTAGMTRAVRQMADESRLRHIVPARLGGSKGGARGVRWIGEHADAADPIKTDIRQRLADKRDQEAR